MSIDKECLDAHLLTSEIVYYSIPIGSIAFDYDIHIDCRNNPQLFRAVTAMRDDSDMWQYFTNGVKLILFDGDDFNEFYIKMNYYRKATLEELKEHFQ